MATSTSQSQLSDAVPTIARLPALLALLILPFVDIKNIKFPRMCGGSEKDLLDPRRFGALAVLKPSSPLEAKAAKLSGQLVFFNNSDHNSQTATHISFTPNQTSGQSLCSDLILTIL